MKQEAPHVNIERSIIKAFRREIWRPFVRGLQDYEMIKDGDKVAVCISGGKDSMLLAKCLQQLKRQSRTDFELEFIVMDPGYNPDNRKLIEDNAALMNIPVRIFDSDIFDIVVDVKQSPCYLCARMRRGYLYAHARELGCNKIALGHHFDDVIETILMGILYGGQINTMMPKLHSTNFQGMELIRPLYYVKEEDILAWKDYNSLHFLQCACRFTEQIAEEQAARGMAGEAADIVHTSKRQEMKELIRSLRKTSRLFRLSSSVTRRSGRTIFTGTDGKPAPVPTSTRVAPTGGVNALSRVRLSTKCLTTISPGSVIAVRFILSFHSTSSSAYRSNRSSSASPSGSPSAAAYSASILLSIMSSLPCAVPARSAAPRYPRGSPR